MALIAFSYRSSPATMLSHTNYRHRASHTEDKYSMFCDKRFLGRLWPGTSTVTQQPSIGKRAWAGRLVSSTALNPPHTVLPRFLSTTHRTPCTTWCPSPRRSAQRLLPKKMPKKKAPAQPHRSTSQGPEHPPGADHQGLVRGWQENENNRPFLVIPIGAPSTTRETVILEQGITGGPLRYHPAPQDQPSLFHYKCTPTKVSPWHSMYGADRAEILVQMRKRAAQFNAPFATALNHDFRVRSAPAASFFFLWALHNLPIRLSLISSPCCGCGTPTPLKCLCERAWLCMECEKHDTFMLIKEDDRKIFNSGRCRLCLREAQIAAGLRQG